MFDIPFEILVRGFVYGSMGLVILAAFFGLLIVVINSTRWAGIALFGMFAIIAFGMSFAVVISNYKEGLQDVSERAAPVVGIYAPATRESPADSTPRFHDFDNLRE